MRYLFRFQVSFLLPIPNVSNEMAIFRIPVWLVHATLLMANTASMVSADTIRYAWSGTIVPNGADDPWSIGQQGKSFSLSATVASDAADVLSDSVQFSAFNLSDADLVVDGQQISYVDHGIIDFTDNSGGILDIVLIAGEFQWNGTKIEIGSAVGLDPATFMFTHENELLPVFTSTANMDRSSCCRAPYVLVVPAGSAVTVVPEPAGGLLFLFGSILLAGTRGNSQFFSAAAAMTSPCRDLKVRF